MKASQVEAFAGQISSMDRRSLMVLLRRLRCKFELDFTDDFLGTVSLERLRHIVVGVMLHAGNARATTREFRH